MTRGSAYDHIVDCRCGCQRVCVVQAYNGTTISCPNCGRSTRRHDRDEAIRAWNERIKAGCRSKTSFQNGD